MSVIDYIQQYKTLALQKMQTYRIPASIILGQGLLESSNGNSELARMANNHFGVKCHKDWSGETYLKDDETKAACFRKYKTVAESYEDHSVFLVTHDRYLFLFKLDPLDYKSWANGLKQAGYASNPDYARLLIKVIEDNRLFELDRKGDLLTGPETGSKKPGKNKTGNDGFDPIVAGVPGRPTWENNGIDFIYAKEGDDVERVSKLMGLMSWQLRRYNDVRGNYRFASGEIVYINSKKRKAQAEYHILSAGEDLRSVAQRYGLKMKVLCRRNHMAQDVHLKAGEKLWLNRRKP